MNIKLVASQIHPVAENNNYKELILAFAPI